MVNLFYKRMGVNILSKERILIVDDEKEIRDLIDIYLKGEGYETLKVEKMNMLKMKIELLNLKSLQVEKRN